jgi:hypothetical protein
MIYLDKIYKSQTRFLVREGAPQEKEKNVIVIQVINIWPQVPPGLDARSDRAG